MRQHPAGPVISPGAQWVPIRPPWGVAFASCVASPSPGAAVGRWTLQIANCEWKKRTGAKVILVGRPRRLCRQSSRSKKACRNLRYLKYKVAKPDHASTMAAVLFLCPSTGHRVQGWFGTGHRVQGWFADNGSENRGETYEEVTCLACKQVHMVNPRTGKVLGTDEE